MQECIFYPPFARAVAAAEVTTGANFLRMQIEVLARFVHLCTYHSISCPDIEKMDSCDGVLTMQLTGIATLLSTLVKDLH